MILRTYTTQKMPVVVVMDVQVNCGNHSAKLLLYVVRGKGPSLVGRDWLEKIRFEWKAIGLATVQCTTSTVGAALDNHAEVFKDELGTFRDIRVKLKVTENATPKFCKPRSVPYAIKEAIEDEFDRLEEAGIISKVSYSSWAAPIAPVPKKDGKFRICGDYKLTVNPVLKVNAYPLPKP